MKFKYLLFAFALALSSGCENLAQLTETGTAVSQAAGYNPAQLGNAVKEALQLSTERASDTLSEAGGYANSREFRIGLPVAVQGVADSLRRFGLNEQVDQVEGLMNRGAELAAGEAKTVFVNAVRAMSVDDAMGIVRGGNTAATDYFRSQTQNELMARYRPIMQAELQKLGFYRQYQQLLSAYKLVPVANKPDLDLEEHAINQGIHALFTQIAVEEQKIRANPVEYGTTLVGAVFGNRN